MQEWYLMTQNTKPNATGGFESDTFLDYKEDAFMESLQTEIGKTVQLYNYDLSECTDIRCIIQENTSNTQLKSMERSILAPIGTLKAGMYIFFENVYWLISGYSGNNGIYEKATMILCQYKLKWQDDSGKIIERWGNFTSASKYDTGENGNSTIILTSNNFTIWIPDDDESYTLDGEKVFIDRAKVNPKKVYKVTRSDDVLYLFGEDHGGILSFIADKTEFNPETDNQELRLCNYHSPTTPSEPITPPDGTAIFSAVIIGNKSLKLGFPRTYSVSFADKNGNSIEVADSDFKWNIVSDFEVGNTINGKTIELYVDDENYLSSSFLLQILDVNDAVVSSVEITVIEGF